jgi:hypothetical protein
MSETQSAIASLKQDITKECLVDYVGLWLVLALLRDQCPGLDAKTARELTIRIVRELLEEDSNVVVGMTTSAGGFQIWEMPPERVVDQIASQWPEGGRDPDIGEIAWLASRSFLKGLRRS